MKKTIQAFLQLAAVAAAATSLQAKTPVRVTADNVNLRAKALLTSEVVTQAHYDDRLTAYEIGSEWVEVAAPATADAWVMKSYVQAPANTIGANRVNVRAGPSINYNILCTLALGDTVEPRGEEVADWLKIAPPPAARVWVSREFVEILSGEAAAAAPAKETGVAENKPAGQDEAAPAAEVAAAADDHAAAGEEPAAKKSRKKKSPAEDVPVPEIAATAAATEYPTPIVSPSVPEKDAGLREIPVPPPANLKLIPLEGQGRLTEVEGELRAAPLINEAPTRYRVVSWQDNRWQILCHVYGEAAKFRSLQDKRVHLKGREYWIQGAAAPVLVPDQVQEVPATDDAVVH